MCTNKGVGAFLSLHGERHDPMSSAFPSKSPVTVPTDEPYFLCSASRWQSELFSSFQCTLWFSFGVEAYGREAKLGTDLLFQGQIQVISLGTSPSRTTEKRFPLEFWLCEWQAMSVCIIIGF